MLDGTTRSPRAFFMVDIAHTVKVPGTGGRS